MLHKTKDNAIKNVPRFPYGTIESTKEFRTGVISAYGFRKEHKMLGSTV